MEEDEQEQRRRKVEAGRAKLAHFRQRKTKGDCAHSKKKTAKRKGSAVDAPIQEERPVASEHGGLLGGGDACKSTSCSDTPDGAGAAQLEDPAGTRTEDSAQLQQKLDANRLGQPGVLTEEGECTCEPAIAEHMGRHEDEAGGQQQAMGGRPPPTEEQQVQLPAQVTQPAAALELEALRLSLSNMHAARLELAQAHLQREKDSALAELRDALNGRHAQELALLHSRQQLQLEEVALRCHQDTAELKEKLKSEVEKNIQIIETLKRDWESERDLCLENLRKELSAKHQSELENLRSQFEKASAEQKAELERTSQARSQAELSLQALQAQHEAALRKLQEDKWSQCCRHVEDLQPDGREQEGGGQLQLQNLQASCEELKAESQEGTGHLWSQLESTRTDRQEPRERPEQLLAQASGVDEWRHGQRDFEQWEQREKSEHEAELEQLRLYFERKLRDAEKSHREDLTLLQQRLQEVREDPLLESVEISSSSAVLEETSEKEKRDRLDQLSFQLQQHEARPHVHTQLEDSRLRQVAAPQEADVMETQVLEPCSGPLEGPGRELTRMHLQTAQDMAADVETAVAARVRGLGAKHEVKLSLLRTELEEEVGLLRVEQRSLHEKLQQEVRLKEDCERAKHDLVEGHQEELRKAKEQIELMKQEFKEREEEWQVACEALKREAEEQLARVLLDARQQAASDRRSLMSTFQLREIEMRQLQDQQAAQIRDLEASLVEQQGRLRQLELGLPGDTSPQCSQCGGEPGGGPAPADWDWELAAARLKEDCALQLKLAQNRFLEQRKEITERFTEEQDAFLREAQEKHAHELQQLQDRHQQHIASLTTALQAGRQADIAELQAALERHHWALSEARVAALQTEHAAEIHALETRHVSDLESVEARYLSEVEALRDDHRRALELLQGDREEELQREDSSHCAVVTRELEKVQQKCEAELQSAEGGPGAEPSADHTESRRAPVAERGGAHQGESESEQKAGLHDQEERRSPTCEQSVHQKEKKEKEKEALCLQLQEKKGQVLQLKDRVASLSRELEARHSELERLQQTRDRENQEGANLIAMLKSDTDVCHSQRTALQDALRRLLGLFGETLKAAIALKSRISERVGLCLEDDGSPDTRPGGQAPFAALSLEEMWSGPDVVVPGLDGTLPEGAETSSVAEISSHLCDSFFMSPESTLECEQPVRRVYQSLGLAVDGLLEMVLDSSRQLEEARQIHARFEKEFSCKSEEMAQVVRKHQELLEHLEEENAAKTQLTLELHKAEGIIEGFKVEKASLQESLGRTEMAEQGLVVELEGLSQQLQQVTRQQAELKEENSFLWRQKEAAAAEAQEREAGTSAALVHKDSGLSAQTSGFCVTAVRLPQTIANVSLKGRSAPELLDQLLTLRREVEDVTKEQSEIRKQSEKDRCSLLAQMEVLEAELEEQLARHRACAEQAGELSALRQQLASLDKYLRSQRHFMDEQAVEREHEREEFQQEIRRLEEQLQQAARPQPWGPPDGDVELLQEKLREKSHELDELVIKKELADRQVLIQEEEIKHLEETNADSRREVTQLKEELQRQREAARELQQDKEALQEQQMSNLLLVSTLQSKLDEDKRPWPPAGSHPEGPEAPLEAVQRALLQRESEAFLQNKEKEIMCVSEQLEAQLAGTGSGALREAVYNRSSEVEELKSIIETLQENQERLQKDKADEIQQLHEVIERLQRELSPGGGPMGHERSDGPAHNLQSELERGLLCLQVGGAEAQAALQAELQAALAAREALSRLLAEQECRHSQALEALQQRLRGVEEATARRLGQPRPGAALREAEAQDLTSQIQEFEAALKAKDVVIAERDLEIEALNRQTLAHCAELEAVRSGLAHVWRTLESQPPGAVHEPPELQQLRSQCVRLSRQLQALNLRFLTCQEELDEQQARGAPMTPPGEGRTQGPMTRDDEALCEEELEHDMGSRQLPAASPGHGGDPQSPVKDDLQPAKALVTLNPVGFHRQDSLMSVLTVCQRQLESELLLVKNEMCLSAEAYGKDKEKLLEDCKLQKVDLITQVKQLHEKLNRLVYSMKFQNIEIEDFKSQQPLAFSHVLENSLSDSSNNGEETGRSPPVDAFNISEITRDLVDVIGNQDSWIRNEMPNVPMEDKVDLQDGSLVSLHSGCSDLAYTEGAEPLKNALSTMDVSWGSPEVVRKDSTLEPLPSLPLTPCSDASVRDRTSASLLQADQSGLLCSPGRAAAVKAPCWAESPSAVDRAPFTDHHVQRTAVEKDVEDFIITSLDSQEKSRSPPLGLEGKSDGSEKSDGGGAEIVSQGPGGWKAPSASAAAPLPASHSFRWPLEAMKEKTVPAQHVEALLQMVCDESRHILALSEYHEPPSALGKGEPSIPLERFPRGAQSLLELVPAPQKGEKEPFGTCLDWRGEFLQAVREAFAKERDLLPVALQPRACGCVPGASLSQRLEKAVQEPGDLQEKSPELLQLSDRGSLLSEVQALRAQLRLTHLQNQEKLQQLSTALTSTEARGSRREHRLRRQVELLAYKVEQEKCIASDLQKTLNEEQEKANKVRKLLVVEENAVKALRSELCECKQDNERLLESLGAVQQEVVQLRSVLDGKEKDLRAALQELESARGEERALQGRLEQERRQRLQAEGQSTQALAELRTSLEKQCAQNNRLCVALKHEQAAKDNLQKELQIESSRCEALLAQERGRLAELHRHLDAEQVHSLELSKALQHERLLTERLSRRAQATAVPHAVPRKLKDEKARGSELQAALEEAQQQALRAQQQLEAQAQRHCEELKREKEVSAMLRSTVQALRTPGPELSCDRETERETPAWLQAEVEQLHTKLAEQGHQDTRRRAGTRHSRGDADKWRRWQRDKEKLRELELQRQRHEHKIQQLQRTAREREAGEAARRPPEAQRLQEQQQGLEKIRQRLLVAAGLLTSFINQTVDRTINDWTSSNEKAVTSLLQTLEELKSELSASSSSQKKMTAEQQVQLVDVLLRDNDSLRKALAAVTLEKAALCRAASRLERTLSQHLLKGCALSRSDRSAWRRDRKVLQSSPGLPDPGLPAPAAREEANTSKVKMEKLYLHYLRAESFRKALIYQKKYLLLLIGGFQDSEQETLSMIAHLGVFPSKADKKITPSRPFTKFRTAVRVVIAISRLRFLVRKWQEVDRKGALGRGRSPHPGFPGPRQQQSPPETSESPPTRDVSSSHIRDPVPKTSPHRRERSSPSSNSRSERSQTASQDPEHSLTEYIHHLEMIQQRLGGVPPDPTSKKSCRQKTKQ